MKYAGQIVSTIMKTKINWVSSPSTSASPGNSPYRYVFVLTGRYRDHVSTLFLNGYRGKKTIYTTRVAIGIFYILKANILQFMDKMGR